MTEPLPSVPRNPRFDLTAPEIPIADLGVVHVLAAGGAGMSAVVRLFLDSGVSVRGSDAKDSPLLRALQAQGARLAVGHDAAALDEVDTVVVSSAIREDNPELRAARQDGIRVLHRSQALATIMGERRRVAIAGANGKTTTSSMLTVALRHAGVDPSFALGGEIADLGTNAALGADATPAGVFVAEADESDGSFIAYHPQVAVVTNVQPDHLDFYGDFATVESAYLEFAETITPGGLLIACADDPGSARLADRHARAGGRVVTYGFDASATHRLSEAKLRGTSAAATLQWGTGAAPGAPAATLAIRVPGRHNLLNAAAALLAATEGLGIGLSEALEGLAEFTGARRRFETAGVVRGVTVVDDYAHNAGKVEAVVATAREIAGTNRLVVLFQPHLFSRTRDFAAEFAAGLAPADEVLLLDVYGAREDPIPGVDSELIAAPLRAAGRPVAVVGREEAIARVVSGCRDGDLVLTVGAGDITELGPRLLEALERSGGDA